MVDPGVVMPRVWKVQDRGHDHHRGSAEALAFMPPLGEVRVTGNNGDWTEVCTPMWNTEAGRWRADSNERLVVEGQGARPRASGVRKQVWVRSARSAWKAAGKVSKDIADQ